MGGGVCFDKALYTFCACIKFFSVSQSSYPKCSYM